MSALEDFVSYLLKEFKLPTDVVCHKVSFNHSSKVKQDKKSERLGESKPLCGEVFVKNNIVSVKIDCFDKDHNLVHTATEKFIDGAISRPKKRPLVNISPDELNNRFGMAKSEICSVILKELTDKDNDIQEKISEVKSYCPGSRIIPTEFVNEAVVVEKKDFEF